MEYGVEYLNRRCQRGVRVPCCTTTLALNENLTCTTHLEPSIVQMPSEQQRLKIKQQGNGCTTTLYYTSPRHISRQICGKEKWIKVQNTNSDVLIRPPYPLSYPVRNWPNPPRAQFLVIIRNMTHEFQL